MPWSDYPLRTLTLPAGAASPTPRIVIGPDVPADLQAYYTAQGTPVVSAIIYYGDTDAYYYIADCIPIFGSLISDLVVFGSSYVATIFEGRREYFHAGDLSNTTEFGRYNSGRFAFGDDTRANVPADEYLRIRASMLLEIFGPWECDGVSVGRGLRNEVRSIAASAAVGAETVVLTSGAITWEDGRAYRVSMRGFTLCSIANAAMYQLRKTNVAGMQLGLIWRGFPQPGAGNDVTAYGETIVGRGAGAGDLAATAVALTLLATAGTATMNAGANFPRWLRIEDVGEVGDYPSAILIV